MRTCLFEHRKGFCLVLVALALLLVPSTTAIAQDASGGGYSIVEPPDVVLDGIPFSVEVEAEEEPDEAAKLRVGGQDYDLSFSEEMATAEGVTVDEAGDVSMAVVVGDEQVTAQSTDAVPGWFSVLPPLIAIAVALITRQVIASLFLGIYIGAVMAYGLSLSALWYGLLDTLNVYVVEALSPPDGSTIHASIIIFTLMVGGLIGIISRNGGMKGIVERVINFDRVISFAGSPRRGQASVGALGLVIFFDDYLNTLVVGNTMRAITDQLKVSREKLAYIVDSTAAPVTTIALISTWIGFQVGLIGEAVGTVEGLGQSAYAIFLNSLPYAFYPILAIVFVFAVALTGRDFGPMYTAEVRSRTEGKVLRDDAAVDSALMGNELEPDEGTPARAFNAVIPILVLIVGVMTGLYVTGSGETLQDIIGSADPFSAVVWGSMLSVLVAAALTVGQRLLSLNETVNALYLGLRSMLFILVILVLAWSLASVTDVLHTGDFLVSLLGESLPPAVLPALIFLVAAATAFATGTSWGTMGILIPLTLPLSWGILQANGMANPDGFYILYASISTVLAGAVWGDHCSPISDTTIISSMASGSDHIDHVRTQLPYALYTGLIALGIGLLPVGFGLPWWLMLPLTVAVAVGGLFVIGKVPDNKAAE